MLRLISQQLKKHLSSFPITDHIIFNHRIIEINKDNFETIPENNSSKSIAFVDGGQGEIISAGNLCLSFIRVGALVFRNNQKIRDYLHEFYLLTTARPENDDIVYESEIFPLNGPAIIDGSQLSISSTDATIRGGIERASINAVANMARRFAELSLCAKIDADIIMIDGILEPSFRNEEKYLSKLPENVCALAKSSSLFTASGNSPAILLNRLNPEKSCWSYAIDHANFFVKLHPKAKHVFRYTGKKEFLHLLATNSNDALFLGYPYGLIAADKFARVSNEEKMSLKMKIILNAENKDIAEYLSTTNAHDILDNLS